MLMPTLKCVCVCVCVCVHVCVCVCACVCVCGSTYAYTCAKNRSVYYAMVSDAPTTLGLKPRNEKVLEYNVILKPAEGVELWLLEKNGEYWQDIQMIHSGNVGPLLFDWPNQEQHDDRKRRLHAKKASHCAIVLYGGICNLAINGAFTLNSLSHRSLSQRHSNTKECKNTPSGRGSKPSMAPSKESLNGLHPRKIHCIHPRLVYNECSTVQPMQSLLGETTPIKDSSHLPWTSVQPMQRILGGSTPSRDSSHPL